MRDRLIELLGNHCSVVYENSDCTNPFTYDCAECLADHLLDNGVIVPPCKVGDVVYVIRETSCEDIDGIYTTCEFYKLNVENLCTLPEGECPYRFRIIECLVTDGNLLTVTAEWNKTVFADREDAVKALKG